MADHRSTTRVLDILELIARNQDEKMSLANISKRLQAPKSSLYPILQTMVARGYLNYDENSYVYSIGSLCYEIGSRYLDNGALSQHIDQVLEHITSQCQETSHFAELNGNEVFYLNKKDSPQSIRMFSSPGKRLMAYSTALGKSLLSDKSDEELAELYPNGLYAVTEHTITSMDVLKKQLEEVRRTGFSYEVEESNHYIRCIAVPIRVNGRVRYAISVAVPVFRYTQEKEEQIRNLLQEAKESLEQKCVLPR
ncbi:MAG: IclR family transcriptional regulator [Erysipelotrichaceae bacterium]|jgi:DNA-binding IclR family transcriptional regulator|nr:IclR family transcriptional regulator [Erysipelotrichaceae bacterium]